MKLSEEQISKLSLAMAPNIGPITYTKIIQYFGTASIAVNSIHLKKAKLPSKQNINQQIKKTYDIGGKIIFKDESSYPVLLRETQTAPAALWIIGNSNLINNKKNLAIIGSRNCTEEGKILARTFAKKIGENGFTITSGMAKGIDTEAHFGSIVTGTIAVLACGIDVVYPKENKKLYEYIKNYGTIISENPTGTLPLPGKFISRNRIITGISQATFIVEAKLKSGSYQAALSALDQNKNIIILQSSINDNNYLINKGAIIAKTPEEIVEHLTEKFISLNSNIKIFNKQTTNFDFSKSNIKYQEQILQKITDQPKKISRIALELGLPIEVLNANILNLELEEIIEHINIEEVILKQKIIN